MAASAGEVDANGNTVLMLAVMQGQVDTVKALLTCPAVLASLSTKNNKGCTALMLAERNGHACMIQQLLRAAI
jgi:ankyrin repeat protein